MIKKYHPFLLNLILPTILTFVFSAYLDDSHFRNDDLILILVSSLLYLLSFFEFIRANKTKEQPYFHKYIYFVSMILILLLGIWFSKEFEYFPRHINRFF